ncbi:uncharacterized protein LOC110017840 [Phalaenopsis equestris]|uniref:uncharacterized protein LOC110017840 n=1 Tax=Phalaenopsis equestris TaxID=78828 RepID=UPI0009E313CD|nr:uncharacterized protein LOC110017840 [Phalaenopsis equestris]XP_020570627.1 uncharacterized protein LOC110017840 [Phalaenopsis equestris]XP_020570628.1 uncharacterized protein LOC110017840 [Phalaenopsis equestris]
MILVAILAQLLEECTALVARVLEHFLNEAPFLRRLRFFILRSLSFTSMPRRNPAASAQ